MATRQDRQQGAHGSKAAREVKGKTEGGFVPLDLDIASVSWADDMVVEGDVVDVDTFHSEKGDKRVLIISIAGVPHRLIEQAGLRRLFEKAKVGDSVWIKASGWRQLEGNNEMRTFEASIKPSRSPAQQSTDKDMRDGRPSRQSK